jgi:hypothetical protein
MRDRIALTVPVAELPFRAVVSRCKRAPQGAPDEAAVEARGAWGFGRMPHPSFGGHNNK